MKTETIPVQGMSCNHCTSSVASALEATSGVSAVAVSLEEQQATVTYDEAAVSRSQLVEVINDLGFLAQ